MENTNEGAELARQIVANWVDKELKEIDKKYKNNFKATVRATSKLMHPNSLWEKNAIAEQVIENILICITNEHNMKKCLDSIGKNLHRALVAYKVSKVSGISEAAATFYGFLSKEEAKGEKVDVKKQSELSIFLGDKLEQISDKKDLVSFDDLTNEKQLEYYQLFASALNFVNTNTNFVRQEADKNGYSLNNQYLMVKDAIKDKIKDNEKE